MILAVAFAASSCSSAVLLVGTRPLFARDLFTRQNYRGAELPTAVGLIVPLSVVSVLAAAVVVNTLGWRAHLDTLESLRLTATAALGFGLLGLLDDLAVDRDTSGYRGHLRALRRGDLSAGALKMLIGPMVALVVVVPASGGSFWQLMADGALVALSANLANLFDRAPGRLSKLLLVVVVVMVIASGASAALAGLSAVAGAVAVLLRPDLKERMMLGDAGANPLGAAAGLAAVLAFTPVVRMWLLIVVVSLNLLSEWVSFTAVIERTRPLRFMDQLGRDAAPPS